MSCDVNAGHLLSVIADSYPHCKLALRAHYPYYLNKMLYLHPLWKKGQTAEVAQSVEHQPSKLRVARTEFMRYPTEIIASSE